MCIAICTMHLCTWRFAFNSLSRVNITPKSSPGFNAGQEANTTHSTGQTPHMKSYRYVGEPRATYGAPSSASLIGSIRLDHNDKNREEGAMQLRTEVH